MMDNPRLVPHVRSRNGGKTREGGRDERAERKKDGREKSVRDSERDSGGVGHTVRACSAVFHHSGLCSAPFRSCRYAAHPRISSPLGSHVIERSPSRGETQPIHILCSPLYILRRERKRERKRDAEKEAKGRPAEGDERDG